MTGYFNAVWSLRSLLLLCICCLCACTPVMQEGFPLVHRGTTCGHLPEYYQLYREMPVETLQLERDRLTQVVADQGQPCEQLYLALLLSRRPDHFGAFTEAEELLSELLTKPNDLSKRDRLTAELLLEPLLLRHESATQLAEQQAQVEQLSKQLREARSKLDQLKNIDRDFNRKVQETSTPSTDEIPYESK